MTTPNTVDKAIRGVQYERVDGQGDNIWGPTWHNDPSSTWYTVPSRNRQYYLNRYKTKERKGSIKGYEFSVLTVMVNNPDWVVMFKHYRFTPTDRLRKQLTVLPPNTEIKAISALTISNAKSQEAKQFSNLCLCGCGSYVQKSFRPGHDAKLKSQLRKGPLAPDHPAYKLESHYRQRWGIK